MAIGPTDLTILVAYLIGTVAFGIYMGRGQKSATDYLLGGRNLPWWALLLSIVATETSTATFLSVPGIAFGKAGAPGNLLFLQLPLGYLVGRAIAAYGRRPPPRRRCSGAACGGQDYLSKSGVFFNPTTRAPI